MLKNYLKIAWRQLKKQKVYSVVKIGGFALSIAACLLIGLYIRHELSYDRWPDADRIYRVIGEYAHDGKLDTGADWPAPMATTMEKEFPEVEKAGRLMASPLFYGAGNNQLRRSDQTENNFETKFVYADQAVLDILKISMVYGKRENALAAPHTMVISRKKAEKFFPHQDPVGKMLILNEDREHPYTIGGVMEDFPANSHIQYDFLLTLAGHELWKDEQTNWGASNYPVYVVLKPNTSIFALQQKMTKTILVKYYLPMLKGTPEADDLLKKARLLLQPVGDIHLRSYQIQDGLEKGDIRFIWLFGAVAVFILLIACINFVNLSTAKSANRAKEVGLRKVVGSYRVSLINQFLTESVLISALSFVLGLLLAVLLLPAFNSMSGRELTIPWTSWWLLPTILVSSLLIGLIAGIYPSFYLSAFKPIDVLKGQLSRGSRNSVLRNGLVIFQFTASIILIIGTIVIYRQTHYILSKDAGFDKDQVLLLQGTRTLGDETENFKNALLKLSQVKSVAITDYLPVTGTKRDGNPFYKEGKTKEDMPVNTQKWEVDYDYVKTMGMKIVEGRDFASHFGADSGSAIINQTMARKLLLKNPIGQRIENGWQKFTVIGVVEDFNYETMKQDIGAVCLVPGGRHSTMVAIKINGAEAKPALSAIEAAWKTFAPHQPIRYTFLDESFANMYADVQRTAHIFTSFSLLAIVIACLGLFGLSAFMAEQRYKEIGIRKVLGASVSGITTLLSRDFIKLVIIAILIASPIAWWAMTKWLQEFAPAYRIVLQAWMPALAALCAVAIALFTVSFQSIKAARLNPAKSLRSE